jgi:predicted transcriptional regulator
MALIPVVHARLASIRRQAVLEMRDRGMSLADIGKVLDLHRNRVQQIAEGRSSGGQGGKTEESA